MAFFDSVTEKSAFDLLHLDLGSYTGFNQGLLTVFLFSILKSKTDNAKLPRKQTVLENS